MNNQYRLAVIPIFVIGLITMGGSQTFATELGKEVSVPNHLQDGDEFNMKVRKLISHGKLSVSYTHLRAHETVLDLVCRLLLDKKNTNKKKNKKTIYPINHAC